MPQQREIILGLVVRTSFEGRTIETHCPPLCCAGQLLKRFCDIYYVYIYGAGYVILGSKCGQIVPVGVMMAVGYDV